MREASWNDCIETNSVKKVSPDIERANSLIETSEERINIRIQHTESSLPRILFKRCLEKR